jgi:hypothetical protein
MTTKAVSTLKDALRKKEPKDITRGEKPKPWSSSKIIGTQSFIEIANTHNYLYHRRGTSRYTNGAHSAIRGNVSEIYGDCTYLSGDVSGITGDCSTAYGDATHLFGDLEGLNKNEPPIHRLSMYGWIPSWRLVCIHTNTSVVEVEVDT